MFSSPNTKVSTKFQNAHKQSVGTKDVGVQSAQRTIKAKSGQPTEMKSQLRKATPKGRIVPSPTPTIKPVERMPSPKERQVQSQKINQTEALPTRCQGGKAKPKPIGNAGPVLNRRLGFGTMVTVDNSRRPVRGFGTYVLSKRRIVRPSSSAIFDYDLSQVEQNNFRHCKFRDPPMKSVPHNELELLRSGQRTTYLEQRYERTPDVKYNYPEATSWRYGWFHRQTQAKLGDAL